MHDDKTLMYQAAVLYYGDKKTQQEIAQLMGISRQTVSKLLNDAVREKIVEIQINNPQKVRGDLQWQLCQKFGIREAIVCGASRDDEALRFLMTVHGAADYILPLIQKGNLNIAVSWGRTMQALVREITPTTTQGNTVFPLLGATDNVDAYFLSNELARELANKTASSLQYAWFPYLLDSHEDEALLKNTSYYRRMQALWNQIDLAIVGIGNAEILAHFKRTFGCHPQDSDAIGDVATHFFTKTGALPELYGNALCASAENIKNAKTTVAVACGDDKVQAIIGALRTGLIDVLVTDEYTAKRLIA